MSDATPSVDAPAPPPAVAPRAPIAWGALVVDLVLVALFWTGIYFRFNWTNWSAGTNLHPDEYGLTNTLTQLQLPDTLEGYFNTRISPLSPYDKYDENGARIGGGPDNGMRWGQWPIILLKAAATLTDNTGYSEQRLLGRSLSALADTLALLLIVLIGRRLYNLRVGLLAGALSALAVMQIQQSHFMTVDNFGVAFTAAAMYCAVRVAQGGGGRWYALFGVAFGMTVASRINLVPLFGLLLVAVFIAQFDRWARVYRAGQDLWPSLRGALGWVLVAGLAAVLTFRVTHPMAFRAELGDTTLFTWSLNPNWTNSMAAAQTESSGIGGGPPAEQWTNRPAIVFPLVNMVLWGMGLPLGVAVWAGLAWAAWRALRTDEWKQHLLPLVWAGGYFLFMGTRWVKSVRYFLPIYPFLALLAAWGLYALWQWASTRAARRPAGLWPGLWPRVLAGAVFAGVVAGTLAWAWGFTSIYRNPNTRVQASLWAFQNLPAPFTLHLQTADGPYREPIPFGDGAQLTAEAPSRVEVRPRVNGNLERVSVFRARHAFDASVPGVVWVRVAADPDGAQVLAEARLEVRDAFTDERGAAFEAAFSAPVAFEVGKSYYLFFSAPEGAPLQVAQPVVAVESWDEGVPVPFDGRDPFGGLYRGLTMEVRWLDDENKRQMFLANLPQVDYIVLPSQRALWSHSRLPNTYPMTMAYYQALFDGRLGFELAAEFQSPITIGPLQVSDVAGTWAWGARPDLTPERDTPFNFNLFAAEEAFSVYDHAPVWIFRKGPGFDFEQVSDLLYSVDLSQVVNQSPRDATIAPSLMMLPADRLAEQRAGGTWSEMFDADSLLNTSQPVAVVVWYLALLALGGLALPLTLTAFAGLTDRGYPLAKTVALLVVTWFAWFLGSFRLLPYTRGTLLLGLAVLAVISGGLFWRRRAEMLAYLRAHRRHILIVEGLGLALFALMLFIRSGNPDLWHPALGGEKPMDFSYFNAVLKSTFFPPYDPWLAGGYLNYYYYGFVVAGVLTKLLGVVPALAYNLIIPMLFSLLGVNAFCVAYNLVARRDDAPAAAPLWQGVLAEAPAPSMAEAPAPSVAEAPVPSVAEPVPSVVEAPVPSVAEAPVPSVAEAPVPSVVEAPVPSVAEAPVPSVAEAPVPSVAEAPVRASVRALAPNAYLAGIAAALMIVVLGNLAQVRTFIQGFQNASDRGWLAGSPLGENDVTTTLNGVWRVATGQTVLPVGLGSWYWDATRLFGALNRSSDFAEFPLFTFLYADLHAHMIVMPFAVLALAWALNYLQGYGRPRDWAGALALWVIGGLVIGVTRPSNTWDYPLYLVLALAAVVVAPLRHGLAWSRAGLWAIAWRAGLLVGLSILFYRPFDQWVAVPLTELKVWEHEKTPLEAYLYHYGLFLFIALSLLAAETRRWLAATPATVLSRAGEWTAVVLSAAATLVIAVVIFWSMGVRVAVIALPLMAWAGLLLLRERAGLADEKRAALFLLGTGLAITLFVDLAVLGGDRMNTFFKLNVQTWLLFSVAGGAALAWAWAEQPHWAPNWRNTWAMGLALLVGAGALYTVTAASAKMRDRFPAYAVDGGGCQPIAGMTLPYDRGVPPAEQPASLNGMDFLAFSAYCDRGAFLPLAYDHAAIRWLQDNVQGSPVLVEAQTFDLYRMSSRYAWFTGLPNVVGWDWHQRQQRGAAPTQYITGRGAAVSLFYCIGGVDALDLDRYPVCAAAAPNLAEAGLLLQDPDSAQAWALDFITQYDVRYIVVGPMERAFYPPGGLVKFDQLTGEGYLTVAYQNPGVTIYEVVGALANQ